MRVARFWMATAICIGGASPAAGFYAGIATASGKQVLTCNGCHYGGVDSEVRFEGPAEVKPGATASFRFVVTSQSDNQPLAGFNVAASDGGLDVVPGEGTHVEQSDSVPSPEITHSYPKAVDRNHEAAWDFTWTAPVATGLQTLYGAGNTANGNSQPTGDRGASTTLVVLVTDTLSTPTPLPTITPTPAPTPCRGDCRRDGTVSVDELIVAVDIALRRAPLAMCPGLDANGDHQVSIDELEAAVGNAVDGCR